MGLACVPPSAPDPTPDTPPPPPQVSEPFEDTNSAFNRVYRGQQNWWGQINTRHPNRTTTEIRLDPQVRPRPAAPRPEHGAKTTEPAIFH